MEDVMQRFLGLVCALALFSCDGGDSDSDVVACLTNVTVFPENGETRAYYRTTVDATFAPEILAGATIEVSGASGPVAGTTETAGNRIVFTPSAALSPGGQYTTTVKYNCEDQPREESASWTVSEVGAATDLNALTTKAYSLALGQARFIEPAGVGALIGQFLTFDLLLGVEQIDTAKNEITMLGALGVEGQPGVQEPCQPTIPFPAADISQNPYFELGPQKFSISVEGREVVIDNLYLSGSFAPDASYIDGAVLAGTIDTRPFKDLVDDNPDAPDTAVCDLAGSLGVECTDCPDNSGKFCLTILADSIQAEKLDKAVERIDDPCLLERCAADEDCQQ
jgi:hypothetical protein